MYYNDILFSPIRLDELETLIQNSVRKVLSESPKQNTSQPEADLITIREVSELLHLSPSTCYSKSSRHELPSMKRGGRLYFSRSELLAFLREGRKAKRQEIQEQAEHSLSNKKK